MAKNRDLSNLPNLSPDEIRELNLTEDEVLSLDLSQFSEEQIIALPRVRSREQRELDAAMDFQARESNKTRAEREAAVITDQDIIVDRNQYTGEYDFNGLSEVFLVNNKKHWWNRARATIYVRTVEGVKPISAPTKWANLDNVDHWKRVLSENGINLSDQNALILKRWLTETTGDTVNRFKRNEYKKVKPEFHQSVVVNGEGQIAKFIYDAPNSADASFDEANDARYIAPTGQELETGSFIQGIKNAGRDVANYLKANKDVSAVGVGIPVVTGTGIAFAAHAAAVGAMSVFAAPVVLAEAAVIAGYTAYQNRQGIHKAFVKLSKSIGSGMQTIAEKLTELGGKARFVKRRDTELTIANGNIAEAQIEILRAKGKTEEEIQQDERYADWMAMIETRNAILKAREMRARKSKATRDERDSRTKVLSSVLSSGGKGRIDARIELQYLDEQLENTDNELERLSLYAQREELKNMIDSHQINSKKWRDVLATERAKDESRAYRRAGAYYDKIAKAKGKEHDNRANEIARVKEGKESEIIAAAQLEAEANKVGKEYYARLEQINQIKEQIEALKEKRVMLREERKDYPDEINALNIQLTALNYKKDVLQDEIDAILSEEKNVHMGRDYILAQRGQNKKIKDALRKTEKAYNKAVAESRATKERIEATEAKKRDVQSKMIDNATQTAMTNAEIRRLGYDRNDALREWDDVSGRYGLIKRLEATAKDRVVDLTDKELGLEDENTITAQERDEAIIKRDAYRDKYNASYLGKKQNPIDEEEFDDEEDFEDEYTEEETRRTVSPEVVVNAQEEIEEDIQEENAEQEAKQEVERVSTFKSIKNKLGGLFNRSKKQATKTETVTAKDVAEEVAQPEATQVNYTLASHAPRVNPKSTNAKSESRLAVRE